ncbi:related to potential regulatory subunit for Glc7p [Phialocephala subalpina]|uniref:Related to potential regulatory subunit for Glc7p n=1 Tax=Phialocephala subalpina TaxID=576137 RepID=A0A1L7WV33_9HELO|nr:related to potential regulatory subunit for Glc7p [Phialocephala subalpina]
MADEPNQDALISQFVELSGASPADAQQYLSANQWNLEGAATEYFTAMEEGTTEAQGGEDDPQETEAYTGPRTLDGRPAPQSIPTVSSSSAPPKKRGGFATLETLGQSSNPHAGHGHDDDDDSDDEDFEPDEQPRDLFAGGEKSGLAVQDPSSNRNDPRKVVNDILKKARANAQRPGGESSSSAPPSRFRGSGQTLGGDDTPSQTIPDPHPQVADPGPTQTRILHLWEDGFSIEDGPLRRFDDPQNAADLQMIRQGRAPLHLMGVRPDQPVDVQLIKHDDAYKAPPKVYKPFSGSGQRLGSPTPGGSSTAAETTPAPAAAPAASSSTSAPEPDVDSSQPTLSLRLQLANGTRLSARFNITHTIGDVYSFVDRAYPGSSTRPWVLATTFPNKDHTDRTLALGDVAEFKRGGTAVQKWT